MFETDVETQSIYHSTRSNAIHGSYATVPRAIRDADLSQLLRNERLNGPSDRDPTVLTKEMIPFKGPYLYVYDMDEKQRPIMVREYAKVKNREDGDWPQFRSVIDGRCPFVELPPRREMETEAKECQSRKERQNTMQPERHVSANGGQSVMQPPSNPSRRRVLGETGHGANRGISLTKNTKPLEYANVEPVKRSTEHMRNESNNIFVRRAESVRLFKGEPLASGVQPSNITSNIRSQAISSTAAAPGAKAGTSKEIHGLQRKVLERNSGPSAQTISSSHQTKELTMATQVNASTRAAKQKTQEKLGHIDEEVTHSEEEEREERAKRPEFVRKSSSQQKRKTGKKDPKPGYCENCQDKFDSFEEVSTSQHTIRIKQVNILDISISCHGSIVNLPLRMTTGRSWMHFFRF
jgi:regulatory subunit for Cdc7p protein kinase